MKLINCPVCGTRVSADAEKCPGCGFEIKKYLQEDNSAYTKKSSRKWIWFPVTIAVILAAVVFLFSFLHAKPAYEAEAETGTAVSETTDTVPSVPVPTSESEIINETTEAPDHYAEITSEDDSPVGVYSGDDHEILVIHDNGFAYYYCVTPEFTELECPWTYSDGIVSIEFSKMHCIITAKKADEHFSELVFRSESVNWNTEVFTKLNLEPDDYIDRQVDAHDPAVTIHQDGTMSFELSGIHFTIPKQYRDLEDEFDKMDNALAFVDNDAAIDYVSTLFFLSQDNEGIDINEETAASFTGWFMQDPAAESAGECTVAGHTAHSFNVSGNLNKGFRSLNGYNCSGRLVIVRNGSEDLYILMVQSDNRGYDSSGIYEQVIESAK